MSVATRSDRTSRLFVALWPREPVRDAIARWQSEWQWPQRAAVVARERLHITLHFLGNVPTARVDGLRAVLRVPWEPFRLEFVRGRIWGGGIAVLQPDHTPEVLVELHAAIGAALGAIGIPVETRPYRAHVTLARRASGAQPPAEAPRVRWEADDGFVLVESLPGGRGYQVLDRFGESR